MYYAWVNEFFMRGEFFLQRNDDDSYTYPDGIGFPNPFKKGVSRPFPLPVDTRFPLPKGPLWAKMLQRHSKRSNDLNLEHQLAKQEKLMMTARGSRAAVRHTRAKVAAEAAAQARGQQVRVNRAKNHQYLG